MKRLPDTVVSIFILVVLLLFAAARLASYADMRLSVGNAETQSYITSSRAPLFSWESFAGKRLFTTNLVFKLANDPARCPLVAISNPAEGDEVPPTLQPCFDRITALQALFAILAWCFLAWTASRRIRHPASRIGVAAAVLLFAFTPQIAEWDSILSPESLSMSLFAVALALLIEVIFRVWVEKRPLNSPAGLTLIAAWLVFFILWVFMRDVHLYAVITTIAFVAPLLFLGPRADRRIVAGIAVLLLGIFILGFLSARDSLRATRYPLVHAFETYVLPYPSRVEFFERFGMPDASSPAYQPWLDDNATRTYGAFLLAHPGFVVTTLWENRDYFRAPFGQQYFEGAETRNREVLLGLGEIFHPETNAVYLLDLLFVVSLAIAGLRRSVPRLTAWAWLSGWYLLSTAIILVAGFFGDTEAYRRHLMPAVEGFRLLMWLLLFVHIDEVASTETPGANHAAPPVSSAPEPQP